MKNGVGQSDWLINILLRARNRQSKKKENEKYRKERADDVERK